MPDNLRVRFRVDGTFNDIGYISTAVAPAICARLKVLAGMDIAEHRLPQDGRLTVTIGTRRLDFRASTFPTIHGEKLVLRMLDQASLRLELTALGMRAPLLDNFREIIRRPEGLILITGPTGSGKTSTLYAALTELVEGGKNITTIENLVEYEVVGINQGQINEKAGCSRRAAAPCAVLRIRRDEVRHPSLAEGKPRHGYDIITALQDKMGICYTSSAGTVYPILQLLEDREHIRAAEVDGKKVYHITPEPRDVAILRRNPSPV